MASEQPKSQAPAEPLWRRVVDVLWYPPASAISSRNAAESVLKQV